MSDTTPEPSPAAPATAPSRRPRTALWLALILVLAVVARCHWSPPHAPFDREFDGFQGGFFGVSMVNYERLGALAMDGYPVANIDADPAAPATWYPYANHTPVLPLGLLAWMRAFGPDGWEGRWAEGAPPAVAGDFAFEATLRAPAWIASLLTVLALFWALRGAMRPAPALVATTLYAAFPLGILQVGLVNYEPFANLFVVLTFGATVRHLNGRGPLALVAVCAAAGAALTYSPLIATLVPCLALLFVQPAGAQGTPLAKRAVGAAAVGLAALVPAVLHGWWAGRALTAHGAPSGDGLVTRIHTMWKPLLDGSVPFPDWFLHQLDELGAATSPLFMEFAALALLMALLYAFTKEEDEELAGGRAVGPFAGALLLLAGGFGVLAFYYTHTADGLKPGTSSQNTFQLVMLPGLAALGGVTLDEIRSTLARVLVPSGGGAPGGLKRHVPTIVTVAIGAVLALTFSRQTQARYDVLRGPNPTRPLPHVLGAELAAALPPGALGLYPSSMGLTPATSFYAWRTLFPVTGELASVQAFEAYREAYALGDAPLYACLPVGAEPGVMAGAAAVQALFAAQLPELATTPPIETEHWHLWRLN